jgi:hypothetical protein
LLVGGARDQVTGALAGWVSTGWFEGATVYALADIVATAEAVVTVRDGDTGGFTLGDRR